LKRVSASSDPGLPRLRLRVKAAAESILRSGHPWLFADSIKEQNRAGETGELAVIYDRKDAFLAVGLYDADSPIRVRILRRGKPKTIDAEMVAHATGTGGYAAARFFDGRTNGYRCINGESDGWRAGAGLLTRRSCSSFTRRRGCRDWRK
jgi:23S rRNA (cytosine1962-C5)-methyltransferase